ncbi:aminopeptidase N [Angustibacter sp. Root456]|uniref:aminopeptidase N n=1 Tax=Angustibacter sp. Root456 TaxID=1736539 RepID=UPI0006FA32D2|nr:aminopeptidase N [Angustibacter sp. Root456]
MPGMNLTRDEAVQRASHLSVSSYDITLDLTTGPEVFRSTTVATFSSSTPGASTFIDLVARTVHEVELNGRTLDPAEVADGVRVQLDDLAAENTLRIVADCLYMNTGEGLHRFVDPVDKEVYLYSQFEVADSRRVFAVFEQPDLKAEFTFTVTAPNHWTVVSNSPTPEPEELAEGKAVWRFAPTPRLASYVTAIVAGPYHVERSELTSSDGRTIPLGVFCRHSLREHLDADNVVEVTKQGFEYFERVFDLPYPFEKYDQLFVPEFNAGAMENAGAVTFLEAYVFRSKVPEALVERRALTILHELAHMWFGDLVTMRWWDDLWLNESFAEWASTSAQAENTRWPWAWTTFGAAEKSWAYRQDQLPTTHPIVADIRDLEDVEVNFDGITYAKGASVLKQLVAYVGEEEFVQGLRRYFKAHAWGNTELADLLRELEVTSGRDLRGWSAQWLQRAGVNTLVPHVEVDDQGRYTTVAIEQTAPAAHAVLRPHRLAVGCYDLVDGRLQRTDRIELDLVGERVEVPELAGRPRADLLLVNDDDLAYTKIRLDEHSLATAVEHLDGFASSMPRSVVLGAAWDMTRDAESPAAQFVELALRAIATESDSTVLRLLLAQLTTTSRLYTAPERRTDVGAHVTTSLLDLARAAEPGSDQQLQLVTAFAQGARSEEHVAVVRGLLDGSAPLEGLAVDTDMRWTLLTSLVAAGAAGEDDIQAELDRDSTANGQRAAAAARAAIPTVQAKDAAWASVVESDELPNAVQDSVILGFGRVHDVELLRPFVPRYFAAIENVWATRTNEIAQQIVVGLYPTLLADEALVTATDEWLEAHPDAMPALRRLVAENRDGVARALRAQATDHQA